MSDKTTSHAGKPGSSTPASHQGIAPLSLDPHRTALVLIDLQKRIAAMPVVPHPSIEIISRSGSLAAKFRAAGAAVVLVTVGFRADGRDRLSPPIDAPVQIPLVLDPEAEQLAPELNAQADDIYIKKHQWGAFYGTDLDLQLRRRGIDSIVIGGIATNFGVESTARDAWERGYKLVFVEDAMAAISAEAHAFAVSTIFPRIGRVRSSAEVLAAI